METQNWLLGIHWFPMRKHDGQVIKFYLYTQHDHMNLKYKPTHIYDEFNGTFQLSVSLYINYLYMSSLCL